MDIVERLRALAREFHQHKPHYHEAANEIERLRVVIRRLHDDLDEHEANIEYAKAERRTP